jgi:alpha-tubulin suppressor-like RCC1 family protein
MSNIPQGVKFKSVSSGPSHSCGVRLDNHTVQCWGRDDRGQANAPAGRFKSVASGGFHSCGVREDGQIQCWGHNNYGQTNAPAGVVFSAVGAGENFTCGMREADGQLQCWGQRIGGSSGSTISPPAL